MLVKTDALEQVGGVESIRDALIDDCSLAREDEGDRARSGSASPIGSTASAAMRISTRCRQMISRSAYAQLKYSPVLLAGVTLGMALTFLAGPLLALFGDGLAPHMRRF